MNPRPVPGILIKLAVLIALVLFTLAWVPALTRAADGDAFLAWEARAESHEAAIVALVEEAQTCTTQQCYANYVGELFFLTVTERQAWWTGPTWDACMGALNSQYLFYLDAAALLYASVYYNLTAEVGTSSIDTDELFATWNEYLNEKRVASIEPAREACSATAE